MIEACHSHIVGELAGRPPPSRAVVRAMAARETVDLVVRRSLMGAGLLMVLSVAVSQDVWAAAPEGSGRVSSVAVG